MEFFKKLDEEAKARRQSAVPNIGKRGSGSRKIEIDGDAANRRLSLPITTSYRYQHEKSSPDIAQKGRELNGGRQPWRRVSPAPDTSSSHAPALCPSNLAETCHLNRQCSVPNLNSLQSYEALFQADFPTIPAVITTPPPNRTQAILEKIKMVLQNIEDIKRHLEEEYSRKQHELRRLESPKLRKTALRKISSRTASFLHSVHSLAQVFDPPLIGSVQELFVHSVRDAFGELKKLRETCQETGVASLEELTARISLELAALIKLLRAVIQGLGEGDAEQAVNESTHRIAISINELHAAVEATKPRKSRGH